MGHQQIQFECNRIKFIGNSSRNRSKNRKANQRVLIVWIVSYQTHGPPFETLVSSSFTIPRKSFSLVTLDLLASASTSWPFPIVFFFFSFLYYYRFSFSLPIAHPTKITLVSLLHVSLNLRFSQWKCLMISCETIKISNIQKKNLSNTTTKKKQLTKFIFKIDKRAYEFICIRSKQRSKDDWNHFILTGHLEASRCLCLLPMPRRVDTQKCHVLQISCYVLISLCITPREYETCWYWQAPTTETGCALTLRRLTPCPPSSSFLLPIPIRPMG